MPVDMSTWTEVDPSSNIVIATDTITVTDIVEDTVASVYAPQSDYVAKLRIRPIAASGSGYYLLGIAIRSSNYYSLKDCWTNHEGFGIALYMDYFNPGRYYIRLYVYDDSTQTEWIANVNVNEDCYIKAIVNSGKFKLEQYSDATFTVKLNETSEYSITTGHTNTLVVCNRGENKSGTSLISAVVQVYDWGTTEQVATPTATPDSCNFIPPLEVALSCATSGATIYYTIDGTTPDDESDEYSTPLCLLGGTILKAIAYKDGYTPSEVATFTYVYASIEVWTNPDYPVSPVTPLRDDLAVKQKNFIETVYLPDNTGYLKITDSNIEIDQYLITKLGSLSIVESGGFRIDETPGHDTLEITETNFEITEVDSNNLTIKPKSVTKNLKQVWR